MRAPRASPAVSAPVKAPRENRSGDEQGHVENDSED